MWPKCGFDLGEELFGAVGGGEVGVEGWRCACERMAAAVSVAARRLPWTGDGGSGLRERGGDGGAEAAGGAGDEGDFAVETEEVEDVLDG